MFLDSVFGRGRIQNLIMDIYLFILYSFCRNLTQRQRQLIEEFAKEEQGEYDKGAAAGASG